LPVERLLILVGLTVLAIVIAAVLQRRRPDPPSAPSYRAPTQLDRADFASDQSLNLVVLFASKTCNTCPVAWEVIESADLGDICRERVDVEDNPALHKRYKIDGVPTTLVVGTDGVVYQTFFGPITGDQLMQAMPHQ